jgi:uncharacterized membrane protein
MIYCSKCGKQLDDNADFCTGCGVKIEKPSSAQGAFDSAANAFNTINSTADTTAEYDPADIGKNKVWAISAYFGILFFLPLVGCPDSKFGRFHANQGLVLLIFDIIVGVVQGIVCTVLGYIFFFGGILSAVISLLLGAAMLILMIIGIVNAANGRAKELPIIGGIKIIK